MKHGFGHISSNKVRGSFKLLAKERVSFPLHSSRIQCVLSALDTLQWAFFESYLTQNHVLWQAVFIEICEREALFTAHTDHKTFDDIAHWKHWICWMQLEGRGKDTLYFASDLKVPRAILDEIWPNPCFTPT